MKIGIFTFYWGVNYGAFLQAYALYRVLSEMGHDVEFVKFRYAPARLSLLKRTLNFLTSSNIFDIVKSFPDLLSIKQNKRLSNDSISADKLKHFNYCRGKYLRFSEDMPILSASELSAKYDALVVGSDQVWADMQSDYLPFFFDRIDDFDGIRISYAACSPKSKAPIYNRAKITKLLGKFADISVRDMNTKSLVSNLGYTSANLVADPTQLYDFTECLDSSSDNIPDKYIFSYIIGTPPKEGHEAYYQHIYSIYGELPIIGVRQNNASYLHHTCMYRDNISPFEWVHMIKNATVVYTDSFHAILFAIKFKIPFIAYYKEHLRASRLVFLKEYYNLDGFIVNKLKDAKIQITPDWKTINVQEQLLVNHSLKFLKRNL